MAETSEKILTWKPATSTILPEGSIIADSAAWPLQSDSHENRLFRCVGKPRYFRVIPLIDGSGFIAVAPLLSDGILTCKTVEEAQNWCEEKEAQKRNEHH